jgi:hypothetical protein
MGAMISYLHAPHPVDAEPLVPNSFGLIPNKLPPILIHLPNPGPEPLNAAGPRTIPEINAEKPPVPERPPAESLFNERWSALTAQPHSALGFASEMLSPESMLNKMPNWPVKDSKAN